MSRDAAHLLDMLLAAREVSEMLSEVTEESFRKSLVHQNAVAYALQKIGEAASRVSIDGREQHSGLDWPNIINMRHRLVHDYKNIDLSKVWFVVSREIPQMIEYLERAVPPDEET